MHFWKKNTITFSSILTTEITEITYTTIKGTITMALGTSTVCTHVYDNSKCVSAERRGRRYYLGPYTSCQYHINNCWEGWGVPECPNSELASLAKRASI